MKIYRLAVGLKSGLSYADSFTFSTRYDGTEYQYIMYKGTEGTKLDLLSEQPTTERNGSTFSIQIKDWRDRDEFVRKCKQQLCYFENVYFKGTSLTNDFKIYKKPTWKFSSLNTDKQLHLCLDNVYYPIDFARLGIPTLDIPIGLNFSIGEGILPIPSREDIQYTPTVKEVILKKLGEVATEIITDYNAQVKDADCYSEIYNKLTTAYFTLTTGSYIEVSSISIYTTLVMQYPTLRGVKYLDLQRLKHYNNELFDDYTIRGWGDRRKFKGKYVGYVSGNNLLKLFIGDRNAYLLSTTAPGNVQRDYLKEKFPSGFYLLYKKAQGRNLEYYENILELKKHPRSEWRERIIELQRVLQKIIDKLPKMPSPDAAWLLKRKGERGLGTGDRTIVGKLEINPRIATKAGNNLVPCIFPAGKPIAINQLHKMKGLYICGEVGVDKARMFNIYKAGQVLFNLHAVLLPPRDMERIKEAKIHNWITINQFMEGNTKPFRVLATRLLAKDLTDNNSNAFSHIKFVELLRKDIAQKMKAILAYERKYRSDIGGNFSKAIFEIATKHNYWDYSIYPDLMEVKNMLEGPLDFLNNFGYNNLSSDSLLLIRDAMKFRKFKMDVQVYQPILPEGLLTEDTEEDEDLEEDYEEVIEEEEENI